jgi:hypothetical protein
VKRGGWHASISAFLLISACGPGTLDAPQTRIEGRWTTADDPRYRDRAFEITENFLYLLQGGDTFTIYKIRDVAIDDADLPHYTIEYRGDEGDLFSFRVYLSQEEGGILFFPNQMDMKWRRDPDAEVPWDVLTDLGRTTPPASGS